MRASRSRSAWLSGRSRRERIVLAGGAGIAAAMLAITLVVLPVLDRWMVREAALTADRERHARLTALVSSENGLRRALAERHGALGGTMRLLLTGASPAQPGSRS